MSFRRGKKTIPYLGTREDLLEVGGGTPPKTLALAFLRAPSKILEILDSIPPQSWIYFMGFGQVGRIERNFTPTPVIIAMGNSTSISNPGSTLNHTCRESILHVLNSQKYHTEITRPNKSYPIRYLYDIEINFSLKKGPANAILK